MAATIPAILRTLNQLAGDPAGLFESLRAMVLKRQAHCVLDPTRPTDSSCGRTGPGPLRFKTGHPGDSDALKFVNHSS